MAKRNVERTYHIDHNSVIPGMAILVLDEWRVDNEMSGELTVKWVRRRYTARCLFYNTTNWEVRGE